MKKGEILDYLGITARILRNLVDDNYIDVDKSNPMHHEYIIKEDERTKEFFKTFNIDSYLEFRKEQTKKRKSDAMFTYIDEHPEHINLISQRTSEELLKRSDKLSESSRKMWENQEHRDKIAKAIKLYWSNEENKIKHSEIIKTKVWGEHRDSMLAGCKKRWEKAEEREKMSKILTDAYKNPEVRKRVSEGVKQSYVNNSKEIYTKRTETKRTNGTFNTSWYQETYTNWLKSTGLTIEEEKVYPTEPTCHCDWYIKELDLWIEGHFSQYHNYKPFDKTNPEHLAELETLKEKQELVTATSQISNTIYQWTDLDVRKRTDAEKNNLNYLCFYSTEDFDNFFAKFDYNGIVIRPWDNYKKILDSFQERQIIYARQCELKEVNLQETKLFLNIYHFQNSTHSSPINLGLYYKDELIQIMTFGKPRYNKNYEYELLRLCTKFGYRVVGGSEKLLKQFEKSYNPKSIISYCDLDKFTGTVYNRLGFTKMSEQKSKHWWSYVERKHFTNNLVVQRGVDQLLSTDYGKGTSNEFLLRKHGFFEILDNGQATFIKLY